jgi:hypothetical protein
MSKDFWSILYIAYKSSIWSRGRSFYNNLFNFIKVVSSKRMKYSLQSWHCSVKSLRNRSHYRDIKKYYQISREEFEPELGFKTRTSRSLAWHSTTWAFLILLPAVQIFLLKCDNVNFPRHKLWVYFHLIIWF